MKFSLSTLFFFLMLFLELSHLQAQVLVHEEPRHQPVFQNKQIRILNVLLPPGDTTQYHIHHTPSLFIYFTSTTVGSQLQGAAPSAGKTIAGTFLFENLAAPNLRIHRVWNMDKDTLHVIDVELLLKDTGFDQKPLEIPQIQLMIDTSWVRAYKLTLSAGNDFVSRDAGRSLVLVSLETARVQTEQGGKTQYQTLEPGNFFEIRNQHSFSIRNTGSTTARFALLELPRQ